MFNVKVGGRIDRIDEMDGKLRIVDYKTGSYKIKDSYIFQTFLYALAEMQEKETTLPIQPVLFFPIKASQEDYNPSIVIKGNVVDDFRGQYAEPFKEGLQEVLNDIFNPEQPFTCTTDAKVCEYCKLRQICGKKL